MSGFGKLTGGGDPHWDIEAVGPAESGEPAGRRGLGAILIGAGCFAALAACGITGLTIYGHAFGGQAQQAPASPGRLDPACADTADGTGCPV